ncbi:MAG: hypothetical protein E3K32_02260 [wastewater metagenome]|nr:hypothetical protein [Candidatus Loosdrechtia aerotolerans]
MEKVMVIAIRAEDGTVMETWCADWDGNNSQTSPTQFTNYKVADKVHTPFPMQMGTTNGPKVVQKSESWNVFTVTGSPGCTYICTSSGCRKVCN